MKKLVLFSFVVMFFIPVSAFADTDRGLLLNQSKKTALVIGNSLYKSAPLKNPQNDASDMAALLKTKGFDTTLVLNGTQREMEKAIRRFGKKIMKGGIGLFYYAGHGMQVDGVNYLIPVGADITAEDEIKYKAVNTNMILSKMETANNSLNMIFLDACRNNPFARSFRSGNQGLAQMDVTRGSLIAFATSPGRTAADGDGRNGLFTKHLIEKMNEPGLEVSSLLKSVRKSVRVNSENKQIPWDVSSLEGDFYFTPLNNLSKAVKNEVKTRKTDNRDEDSEIWEMIRDSEVIDDFQYYLDTFPNGRYRKAAEFKIKKLSRRPAKKPVQQQAVSVGFTPEEWEQLDNRRPGASITYPDGKIRIQGAHWTNGRVKNGYADGNGVQSTKSFNFVGKKSRIKFKMISPSKYAAIDIKPLHVPVKGMSTNNSWAGSKVIRSGVWYYQTTTVDQKGRWKVILSTGNYADKSGSKVFSLSGKMKSDQLEKLKDSPFLACFGDNYAGTSAVLYLAEARIEN